MPSVDRIDEGELQAEAGIGDPAQPVAVAAGQHDCRRNAGKGDHRQQRHRPGLVHQLDLDHADPDQEADQAVDDETAVQPGDLLDEVGPQHRSGKQRRRAGGQQRGDGDDVVAALRGKQRDIEDDGQQDQMTRRLAVGPIGHQPQQRRQHDEQMRGRAGGPVVQPAQHQPGAGQRNGCDGERIGSQRQRGNSGADAPGDERGGFVAAHMVHLADQGHRGAERRRCDQIESLADRRVIAGLQHRAADIAAKNGRKQRRDPEKARKCFPVGGDQHQDRRPEQQRGHHRQHRAEAQRLALVLLDVAHQLLRQLRAQSGPVRPSAQCRASRERNNRPFSPPKPGTAADAQNMTVD